ncbi:thioesterase family protein [Chelatococcus sambhunathii]|uniref:Thioesterase family protein n=1 Tax=Chelatococcus sambhunathii TaxID=363953 RepID=A0ABU1DBS5_9HYPH|nr:thioesterase family protein [Chelatococcus sambhunathii]MDR4305561.1 thioesterase family protein [Chelatococcus sambhunathii]
MTDAAFLSPPLEIEERFLDYNGHVNMAYHLVLADRALDLAFEEIKGGAYLDERGLTTFAAEMHVRYLREINLGDEVRGRVRFVDSDAKRALWAIELVRGDEREVTTTVEGVSLSVDLATRKVTPFPDDIASKLAAAVRNGAEEVARLDWLGRRVAMSKG